MQLYSHALESIFSFLPLSGLANVLAVSRTWAASVEKMRSIGATLSVLSSPGNWSLENMCESRLARHVGEINSSGQRYKPYLTQQDLSLVGLRMTKLHTLDVMLCAPFIYPALFPPSLTHLALEFSETLSASSANVVMEAIANIPGLISLELINRYPTCEKFVILAPLRRSTCLQALRLMSFNVTDAETIDDIRAIPDLKRLNHHINQKTLRLLLRAPHQLQLRSLDVGSLDAEDARMLASLPLLSKLCVLEANDLDFLGLLPNLEVLHLFLPGPLVLPAGVFIGSKIVELHVSHSSRTSSDLQSFLSRLPSLETLSLTELYELDSLGFLTACPRITTLELNTCRNPILRSSELAHIFSLRELTRLVLVQFTCEPLNSSTLHEFRLRSERLPKLVEVHFQPPRVSPDRTWTY